MVENHFILMFLLTSFLILNLVSSTERDNNTRLNNTVKQCNTDRDCGHGFCDGNFQCNCNYGYIDFTNKNGVFERCAYAQKSQLRAFLYELFFNFGAGHFYLNKSNIGFIKMGCFLFGLFLICLFPLSLKFLNERFESDFSVVFFSCIYYYYAIGLAVWYIYDLVNFGLNNYSDSNGMPLRKWGD